MANKNYGSKIELLRPPAKWPSDAQCKHTGLCAIAFEEGPRQRHKAASLPFPLPEPRRERRPASERPPPKPRLLPGAPESWHGTVTGHVEEDVWEGSLPRSSQLCRRNRCTLLHE